MQRFGNHRKTKILEALGLLHDDAHKVIPLPVQRKIADFLSDIGLLRIFFFAAYFKNVVCISTQTNLVPETCSATIASQQYDDVRSRDYLHSSPTTVIPAIHR